MRYRRKELKYFGFAAKIYLEHFGCGVLQSWNALKIVPIVEALQTFLMKHFWLKKMLEPEWNPFFFRSLEQIFRSSLSLLFLQTSLVWLVSDGSLLPSLRISRNYFISAEVDSRGDIFQRTARTWPRKSMTSNSREPVGKYSQIRKVDPNDSKNRWNKPRETGKEIDFRTIS